MTQNTQQQPERWQRVGGNNNPRWEPNKIPFDPNNPPQLMGYYTDIKEINGPRGAFNVAEITVLDETGSISEVVDVGCSAVLADKLSKVTLGSFILITFMGTAISKRANTPYNLWDVQVDTGAIPFDQIQAGPPTQQPVQRQVQNHAPAAPAQNQQYQQRPAANQGTQSAPPQQQRQQPPPPAAQRPAPPAPPQQQLPPQRPFTPPPPQAAPARQVARPQAPPQTQAPAPQTQQHGGWQPAEESDDLPF